MSTTETLWLILAISVLNTAIGAPLAWEFRQEMARAKARLTNYAPLGWFAIVSGAASIALWWWYAVATEQLLLGVIPTVGWLWGVAMRAAMNAAKKGARP